MVIRKPLAPIIAVLIHLGSSLGSYGSCSLFEKTEIKGLTKYWNKQYTGADLVSEALKKRKFSGYKTSVGIWDIYQSSSFEPMNQHGYKVGNIISGPYASSILSENINLKNYPFIILKSLAHLKYAEESQVLDLCEEKESCPDYVNISMSMTGKLAEHRGIIETISLMEEKGVVFIVSGGNDNIEVVDVKKELARKSNAIFVGSLGPKGHPSLYNNIGEEITILAPSEHFVITHDKDGLEKFFGGTSAAVPQVTAALTAFNSVTGYKLNSVEAKRLLQETAIPFSQDIYYKFFGSGILNTYKIYKVAEKLNQLCKEDKNCISEKLKMKESYSVEASKDIPENFKIADFNKLNCSRKKKYLTRIKKLSLLETDNSRYLSLLSQITEQEGYAQNSQYYKNLSSPASNLEELLKQGQEQNIIKLFLSHPEAEEYMDLVTKIVQSHKADNEIIEFLLPSKSPDKYFMIYEKILKHTIKYDYDANWILFVEGSPWKEFYRKKLDENGHKDVWVSSENIRDYLL